MPIPQFEDRPPESDGLTEYDKRHLTTYLRLLHAANEGADWREAISIIFEIDPDQDLVRAKTIYDTHLARARWMTEKGYREILKQASI